MIADSEYVDSMGDIGLTLVYLELNRVYSRSNSPLDDGCSGTRALNAFIHQIREVLSPDGNQKIINTNI